ncbi:hypothetical protein J7T55_005059 [Diaporthe amygdali]|uniref:uncharacterized protein n=1 Tax=Phomopsis amygdali TaxID=1214568 RepID=UPI0022FEA57F|nr:uncharacterized protein J7T55_005059 [Diaporthe amygdali]KAJ0116113.1 hypothetical protein J7T55_005059 [Diaporthe amygdali]
MKQILGLTAICCSIVLAEAGVFKWTAHDNVRRWTPAQETFGLMPLLGMNPVPTSPPRLEEARDQKRADEDNTCAYVNGDPDIPLYCDVSSACVYNSVKSNIGCCPDTSTSCSIWTTCLDSSDKNLFTTDNGYTLWCGSSEYPYCKTHLYKDDAFTGYTLLGCAVAAGTDSVVYKPTLSTTSSSSSSTSISSHTSSLDVEKTPSSITQTSSATTAAVRSNPTITTAAARSGSSSAPIGAIVGGVVGGVAVLALFTLGLVLLLRRRRHHQGPGSDQHNSTNPAGGFASQPPPSQPAMQQQFQQPNFQPAPSTVSYVTTAPPLDNRSSIAKPSPINTTQAVYDPTTTGSPPPQSHSPGPALPAYQATNTNVNTTPASQTTSLITHDAPQQQRPGVGVYQDYHSQVQPAHQQQNGDRYYEMPLTKSDRELRELA